MRDRFDCVKQAQHEVAQYGYNNGYGGGYRTTAVNGGVWLSCMGARGYTVDPRGALSTPESEAMFFQ